MLYAAYIICNKYSVITHRNFVNKYVILVIKIRPFYEIKWPQSILDMISEMQLCPESMLNFLRKQFDSSFKKLELKNYTMFDTFDKRFILEKEILDWLNNHQNDFLLELMFAHC
jgi:hypothetical protein